MRSAAAARAWGPPALFVVLWSSGFVGARYGLPDADPFTFLALRLAIAGALLPAAAALPRAPAPAGPQWGPTGRAHG